MDKKGIIRYIDIHDIDQQPDNEELYRILREIDPEAARIEAKVNEPAETTTMPKGGIILYCTSWCPDCRRARNWLKSNNLNYIDVDIDANPAASEQVKKWNDGKRITPTFDIAGTILSNFDEQKLTNVLIDKGLK